MVAAAKRALVPGISVPLSYLADSAFVSNGVYRAYAVPDKHTGHAVLVTAFVNNAGRECVIPEADLRAELAKGYDSLAYLKFKNSWGLSARTNERAERLALMGSVTNSLILPFSQVSFRYAKGHKAKYDI